MRLLLVVVLGLATGAAAKTKCLPGFEEATGVVFDEDGKPIKDGSIELFPLEDFESFTATVEGADQSGHYVELAAHGRWSGVCLRKGAYEVQVHSRSFAPVVARGVTGTRTRISVRVGNAVIAGRFLAAAGVSAKDLRASIEPRSAPQTVQRYPPRPRALKIGRDLAFTTPPLEDGAWLISAYDFSGRRVEHAFEVLNGQTSKLEVAFKLATISGTVLDRSGATVADAGVSARAESLFEEIARSGCGTVIGRRGFHANTDAEGRFVISDLSVTEKYRVEARGAQGKSESLPNVTPGDENVKLVTDRSTETSTLVVSALAPGTQIELRRPRRSLDSETQEEGPVRFEEVEPGIVGLDVFAVGKAARSLQVMVKPGEELAVDPISMVAERPLRVLVRDDATGAPIAGARILLENRLWQRAQLALSDARDSRYWPWAAESAVTELRGLSTGPVAFSVYVKGYARAQLVAGPTQSEIEVRLKAHEPAAVSVIARDGGLFETTVEVEEGGVDGRKLAVVGGKASLPSLDPGLHVLVSKKGELFPAWFTSGADGGVVTAYEAVGGASLRVGAYSEYENEQPIFRLAAGDVPEPRGRHPLWVLEQTAVRPRWRGQSGVQFGTVRPGQYTVFVYEPERRLGETLRYRVWRRVLELAEGRTAVELESFEQRPDLVLEWPPPYPVSPNPME